MTHMNLKTVGLILAGLVAFMSIVLVFIFREDENSAGEADLQTTEQNSGMVSSAISRSLDAQYSEGGLDEKFLSAGVPDKPIEEEPAADHGTYLPSSIDFPPVKPGQNTRPQNQRGSVPAGRR